ncbi:MAG: alkaline phosphatase D family protein [Pirellulales bacterium]
MTGQGRRGTAGGRGAEWQALGIALILCGFAQAADYEAKWPEGGDRVWVGPQFWANRLQDWQVKDGRVECLEASPQRPMRTLQLLDASLGEAPGELVMSVRTGVLQRGSRRSADTWTGFLLGAGGAAIDYRLTALVHHRSAEDGGLLVAVDGTGRVIFRDNNAPVDADVAAPAVGPLRATDLAVLAPATRTGGGLVGDQLLDDIELRVEARPQGDSYIVTASALLHGKVVSSAELRNVPAKELDGSVALVSHLGPPGATTGYWYKDWKLSGRKVNLHPQRAYGPVLGVQYTQSGGVLKLTAQMPPLGTRDSKYARLEVRDAADQPWRLAARADLVEPGSVFPFRVEKWDGSKDREFRVVYDLRQPDDSTQPAFYEGVIRREPTDKDQLVVAALSCNKNFTGGLRWNHQGLWFPHQDLVAAVSAQKPDLLFFAGDQVYEGDLTGVQRTPADKAQLDYLDKWFRWCWAFSPLTRVTPTICLTDDHDVYHGNLWGAGGKAAKTPDDGGYVMPPEFVNMVQRTQTSHLPDPVDGRTVEQDIEVYFTRLEYAGVSFALLEDRKFKSSPTVMVPDGRAVNGWFRNPQFDAARQADVAGAELLGDRQMKFLREWSADWSNGVWMKAVLSQTIFANVATLPKDATNDSVVSKLKIFKPDEYPADDRPVADADSNGWPQTARNAALREIRRGFAVHIAGDQHLSSLVRYGVDAFDDAGFAFCVPAIGNTFPRRWYPSEAGQNHKSDLPRYTGQFRDGFGNRMTVHAVANPVASGREPAALHDRSPGYGIVRFHRKSREITFESWPRWAQPGRPDARQYPGWPVTIAQADNYTREAAAELPAIKVSGLVDPVMQVLDEATEEIVYTLRIQGTEHQPRVAQAGRYTVKVGEPGTDRQRTLIGLEAKPSNDASVVVDFGTAP